MSDKNLRINLHIYDTDIPLNIVREEEEHYRKSAVLINERLNAYFGKYKNQIADKQIMYYTMIDIAMKCVTQSYNNEVSSLTEELNKLSKDIDDAIAD